MRDNFKRFSDIRLEVMTRLGQGKKQGDEFVCCCPFHEERNPSFSLNMEKGVYYCFGCGASGGLNQLATKLGIITEGTHKPVLKRKSKPRKMLPWQLAKRISEAFDAVEDLDKEAFREKRIIIEENWNEGRISEAKYYRDRQLIYYIFDCKMEIHDEIRQRLSFEAKNRADNE